LAALKLRRSSAAVATSTRHPLGEIIRLTDDGSECNFLDKALVSSRRFGDRTSITRRPKNNGLLEE
jgi:hypothetical protein